jgi:hypothetical protein
MNGKYPPEFKVSDTHYVSCYKYQDQGEIVSTRKFNVEEL